MGIFSSLFSRDTEEYEDDESGLESSQESQKPESAPTGELCKGMRLEVTAADGTILLAGRITALTPSTLTLERLPGGLAFKTCSLGAEVHVNGYDKNLIPISLRASVQESTRTVFKLKDLQVERHSENRNAFRLPISAPASLYRQDDIHFKNPEECLLIDISTGGACVQSEYIHMEDEVLRLRIKLDDYAPLTFLGEIVRCVEHTSGQFRYGFLFAQLTEEEITALNKTLFNLQMGIKKTHMRTDMGHW